MKIKGRPLLKGIVEGEALVSDQEISFYGGVDPNTGIVVEKGHAIEGRSVKDKILVFPKGKGSTVGSYTLYRLKKNGVAPKAIINLECDTIVAVGAVISEIPLMDKLEQNPLELLKTGMRVKVDATQGFIEF
jgi:hypothetical protein